MGQGTPRNGGTSLPSQLVISGRSLLQPRPLNRMYAFITKQVQNCTSSILNDKSRVRVVVQEVRRQTQRATLQVIGELIAFATGGTFSMEEAERWTFNDYVTIHFPVCSYLPQYGKQLVRMSHNARMALTVLCFPPWHRVYGTCSFGDSALYPAATLKRKSVTVLARILLAEEVLK